MQLFQGFLRLRVAGLSLGCLPESLLLCVNCLESTEILAAAWQVYCEEVQSWVRTLGGHSKIMLWETKTSAETEVVLDLSPGVSVLSGMCSAPPHPQPLTGF